jgi:hypothetical protein
VTRRHDLTLAALIAMTLTLCALLFLAVCQARGFDDRMCRAYHACDWRDA